MQSEKEKIAARQRVKSWRAANPEKVKAWRKTSKAKSSNARRNKAWKERNPEHFAALNRSKATKSYYKNHEENKEAMRLRANKRYADTPHETRRDARLRQAYGITQKDIDEMLDKQGGVCAGCGRSNPMARGWQVDHCHDKKHIRGILCTKCNTGLGLANDDPAILQRWIDYLTK